MYRKYIKRFIDIILSATGLLILLVPMLVLAIIVKLDSRGPVLFWQRRIGIHKTEFLMPKFRSMYVDTPANVPTHMMEDPERWITRSGRFMRKYSLDELPQIWSILAGDMSIVGPRPALWNQDDLVEERDKYGANDVLPGLTGWAQINGRDELDIPVKAQLDGEYARNISFSFDCRCFFGSIGAVLRHDGFIEGAANDLERENSGNKSLSEVSNMAEIKPFENKVWLSTPTMHGDELAYMKEAYETNWMSTVGANINEVERAVTEKIGCGYAVALSSGTAALHLAMKLAGIKPGTKVFCSDLTFAATVNPVVYEGGIPVFIDTEPETWNMDPAALEMAFRLYPEVKHVVVANLYGVPGKMAQLREICDRHGAILIEDAAESMGATYQGKQTGTFGDLGIVSFNGNKIITGSSGGMLLTNAQEQANKVRKWSTQSREDAPWYQHEELGYNYRMSNVVAGVVRGQLPYLEEHIARKKAIYMRYQEGLRGLPVTMNPYDAQNSEPNFWLSCILIDKDAMCPQVRGESDALYNKVPGKSCPTEILEKLAAINAEGRPVWKPMHMQPIFRMNGFVTREGDGRARTNAYIAGSGLDVGVDLFNRGLCLPSDIKMTPEEQDVIIALIRSCFA